ncbi:MAG: hypothetical protein R2754_11905 [Microthrixaceae bacterium]
MSGNSPAPYDINHHGGLRGLDPERRLAYRERSVYLFLTDSQLLVASAGGQFRVRPKKLLFGLDRAGLRCEWFDYSELKTRYRNFMFFLPDGQWMGIGVQVVVFGKENQWATRCDEFVAQLGAAASEIDWRNPPPL